MSQQFSIIAQLQLKSGNVRPAISQIKQQLGGIGAVVDIKVNPTAARGVSNLTDRLENLHGNMKLIRKEADALQKEIGKVGVSSGPGLTKLNRDMDLTSKSLNRLNADLRKGSGEMARFGEQAGLAFRRYLAFQVGAYVAISRFTRAAADGIGAAMRFEREMIRIQQVGGDSNRVVSDLANEITRLSTGLGVSSASLSTVATTLRQAGLAAREVKEALSTLAKTSLSPTFDNIQNTTEGLIALRQQFNITGKEIESAFGSINTVSAQFAVESSDLIEAIKRTGGAFRAASGDLAPAKEQFNQLLALFTSVRQTTRESADTIATSFRTIFARLQRTDIQNQLKEMGINLRYTADEAKVLGRNVEGQFIGAYNAIERLSKAVANIPTTDRRFANIVTTVGGDRQVSKVIPLLQQAAVRQRALTAAQSGNNSLTRDAEKAQQALITRLDKLKEGFLDLFRVLAQSHAFGKLIDFMTTAANAATKFAKAMGPLLPLLGGMAAWKVGASLGGFASNYVGAVAHGRPRIPYASGGRVSDTVAGVVPGHGFMDKVPALLAPGEVVLNQKAAKRIGYQKLAQVNQDSRYGGYGSEHDYKQWLLHKRLADKIKARGGMSRMYERFAFGGKVQEHGLIDKVLGTTTPTGIDPSHIAPLQKIFGNNVDVGSLTNVFTARPRDINKMFGGAAAIYSRDDNAVVYNPRDKKAISLLTHELAHAVDFRSGADGQYASKSKGHPFNEIAKKAVDAIFNQIPGRRDFYEQNGKLKTSELPESFAAALETYAKHKLGQDTDGVDINSDAVKDIFDSIDAVVLPTIAQESGQTKGGPVLKKAASPGMSKKRSDLQREGYFTGKGVTPDKAKDLKSAYKEFYAQLKAKKEAATTEEERKRYSLGSVGTGSEGRTNVDDKNFVTTDEGITMDRNIADYRGLSPDEEAALREETGGKSVMSEERQREYNEKIEKAKEALRNQPHFAKVSPEYLEQQAAAAVHIHGSGVFAPKPPEEVQRILEGDKSIPKPNRAMDANFVHDNQRIQAGLENMASHYGDRNDTNVAHKRMISDILRGNVQVPNLGQSTPHVLGAYKELAGELGYEIAGEFSHHKESGEYSGIFRQQQSSEDLFGQAKGSGLMAKHGNLSDLDTVLKARKDAGRKFIMSKAIDPLKERLVRQRARELGAKVQFAGGKTGFLTKGHMDFDPEDTGFSKMNRVENSAVKVEAPVATETSSPASSEPAKRKGGRPKGSTSTRTVQPKGFKGDCCNKIIAELKAIRAAIKDIGIGSSEEVGRGRGSKKRRRTTTGYSGGGDPGRHAFIMDYVNQSGATTYDEKVAAAARAKEMYDGSTGSRGSVAQLMGPHTVVKSDKVKRAREQYRREDSQEISRLQSERERLLDRKKRADSFESMSESERNAFVAHRRNEVTKHAPGVEFDERNVVPTWTNDDIKKLQEVETVIDRKKFLMSHKNSPLLSSAGLSRTPGGVHKGELRNAAYEASLIHQNRVEYVYGGNRGHIPLGPIGDDGVMAVPSSGGDILDSLYGINSNGGGFDESEILKDAIDRAAEMHFEQMKHMSGMNLKNGPTKVIPSEKIAVEAMRQAREAALTRLASGGNHHEWRELSGLGVFPHMVTDNASYANYLERDAAYHGAGYSGRPTAHGQTRYTPDQDASTPYGLADEVHTPVKPTKDNRHHVTLHDYLAGHVTMKGQDVLEQYARSNLGENEVYDEQKVREKLLRQLVGDEDFGHLLSGGKKLQVGKDGLIRGVVGRVPSERFEGLRRWSGRIGGALSGIRGAFGRGSDRLQAGWDKVNSRLGGYGVPLVAGAAYLAPTVAGRVFGTVENAKTDQEKQLARQGAGIGGALSGAASGAMMGATFGPWGAAIGGAIGGLTGFVSALKNADRQIEEIDFAKKFERFSSVLDDVASGKTKLNLESIASLKKGFMDIDKSESRRNALHNGFWDRLGESFVGRNVTGLFGYDTSHEGRVRQRADARKDFIQETLGPQAGQLQALAERIAVSTKVSGYANNLSANNGGTAARFNEFVKNGGGEVAQKLAELKGISLEEFARSIDEVIVEANKERMAREAGIRVIQQQSVEVEKFSRISQAIQSATDSIVHLQNSADALQAAFDGTLQAIPVKGISSGVASLGGLNGNEFNESVSKITGALGGESNNPFLASFGHTARGMNTAAGVLPGIISRANATGDIEGTGLVGRINEGMQGDMGIPKFITERLSKILDTFDAKDLAKQASEDVNKLVRDLLEKGFANVSEVLTSAAKQLEERFNAYNQGLIQNQAMISKIGESQDRYNNLVIESQKSHSRVAAELTGRPSQGGNLPLGMMLEPFHARQSMLTGMGREDANNPVAIGRKLADYRKRIATTQQARDEATGPAQSALSEELAKLQGGASRLLEALHHLADASDKNAVIQEKLNRLEEDRNSRLSYTEKLLTADPSQRMQMMRGAMLSNAAFQQGHLGGFSHNQRADILEHLSSLGEANLPGYGNRTASDVRKQLILNTGKMLGAINPNSERQRIGLMGEQAKNADTAVKAQEEIINHQKSVQDTFFNQLRAIQQQFFARLETNLLEAEKRDLSNQKNTAESEMNKSAKSVGSIASLRNMGLDLGSARRLAASPEIVELQKNIQEQASLKGRGASLVAGLRSGKSPLKNHLFGQLVGGEAADSSSRTLSNTIAGHLGISADEAQREIVDKLKSHYETKTAANGGRLYGGNGSLRETVAGVINDHSGGMQTALADLIDKYKSDKGGMLAGQQGELLTKLQQGFKGTSNQTHLNIARNFTAFQQTLGGAADVQEGQEGAEHAKLQQARLRVHSLDTALNGAKDSKGNVVGGINAKIQEAQNRLANTNTQPEPQVAANVQQPATVAPAAPPQPVMRAVVKHSDLRTIRAYESQGNHKMADKLRKKLGLPLGAVIPKPKASSRKVASLTHREAADARKNMNPKMRVAIEAQEKNTRERQEKAMRKIHDFDSKSTLSLIGRQGDAGEKIAQQRKIDADRHAKFAADFKRRTGKDLPGANLDQRRKAMQAAQPAAVPGKPVSQEVKPKSPMGDKQVSLEKSTQNLGGIVSGFNSAINNLGSVLGQMKIPDKITLERGGKIEVVLNGAEVMKSIQKDLAETVTKDVMAALKEQVPKIISGMPA